MTIEGTSVSDQRVSANILVTADERSIVLAGLRALRAGGYRPWVASARRGTYATRSRAAAGLSHNLERIPSRLAFRKGGAAASVNAATQLEQAAKHRDFRCSAGAESEKVAPGGQGRPWDERQLSRGDQTSLRLPFISAQWPGKEQKNV